MVTIQALGFETENGDGIVLPSSEEFATRNEAERHVRRHVETFDAHGYNRGQDYWWARSKRDKYRFRRFHVREA
jgi:hypothetical protein